MANINSSEKLWERFNNSGRTVAKYARVNKFTKNALKRVLDGVTTGVRIRKEGETRRIIASLKDDAIWIGVLPWEE